MSTATAAAEDATRTAIDRDRVNEFMKAFRYGGQVSDLSYVDDRHHSGRYDDVTWHIALDGATLVGYGRVFRKHLVDALERGMTEKEAEEFAYHETAEYAGLAH